MAEAELKELPDTEAVIEEAATPADETVVEDKQQEETVAEEQEETIVTFGGDDDQDKTDDKSDNTWVKDLRKKNREQAQQIQEFEKAAEASRVQSAPLGPRPTLEDAEFDADLYENQLIEWLNQKNYADNQAYQQQEFEHEQQRSFQSRLDQYNTGTKEFSKDNFSVAEEKVKMVMSPGQQGIMVHALGEKLANLIVGLSKNNTELAKLSAIKDPTLFAVALGQLENKMTVTRRKPTVVPEVRLVASGGGGVTGNSTLETLRDKAEETGNYTEVLAYKRKMKDAGK